MTLSEYVNRHYNNVLAERSTYKGNSLRLGQRFVIDFIKKPWPELFYEEDDITAREIIAQWLNDNHYFDELPEKVR